MTEARSRVMTFSTPLDERYHAVYIPNPTGTGYNIESYTLPLTNITWLIIIGWIMLTPPILFIVARSLDYNQTVVTSEEKLYMLQ